MCVDHVGGGHGEVHPVYVGHEGSTYGEAHPVCVGHG